MPMSDLNAKLVREARRVRAVTSGKLPSRAVDPVSNVPAIPDVSGMPLYQLMELVSEHWEKPYFSAEPYIAALGQCADLDSNYGLEKARDLVPYFLINAATWRGPFARLVKAELRARIAR